MYLKALEIQGFKSFPEKTRLSFEKDITVIVGPNGSGKSNLSDALLWVMGEQKTRMLRGGKMEDVIFGGTEKRGAMGFAQVTLILDNASRILDMDTDEVSISRRYYRSGDSEYYINREQVRLRDVTELLMDTGLGTDGYSIIGQGRISEIVSAKSTDRREIFEETGINVKNIQYRGSQSWPFPRQLMLAFYADYESGEIKVQEEEIEDAKWFDINDLPATPAPGSIAYRLIHGEV